MTVHSTKTKRIPRKCEICGALFHPKKDHTKRKPQKYCSRKCYGVTLKGRELTEQLKANLLRGQKLSLPSPMKGKKLSEETRRKISKSHLKRYEGYIRKETVAKQIRKSFEYKLWRESVFKRDDYTCQHCKIRGSKGNRVEIQADHIKPFAAYPELRFELSNGRTLCRECHMKTETFGNGTRKIIKHIEEWDEEAVTDFSDF